MFSWFSRRKAVRVRLLIAAVMAVVLPAALLGQVPAAAVRPSPPKLLAPQTEDRVSGHVQVATPIHADKATAAAAARAAAIPAPVWPKPSTVDVSLSTPRPGTVGEAVRASGSAVSVAAPNSAGTAASTGPAGPPPVSRLRVQTLDRATTKAAGIGGVLLRLSRVDGATAAAPVEVTLDYSAFVGAYGADWAARLRLVRMPACAVTTPQVAGCADVTPLPSDNSRTRHAVTADVTVGAGGTVVALDAAAKSGAGNYSATSLTSSSTWSAGGNTGDFGWTYPIRVPPSLGGPAPDIGLSYSSQSVDGRMAASNNQPSWVGEGFEWWPGYVERSYQVCADDMDTPGHNNTVKTGDQCWETDNATLSLSGHSGELLKDPTDANRWHLRGEDGSLVTHHTGAGNGDNDGEWWVVTTPNGTQYWFGGVPSANSTLTEPVFGNDAGEPCHASAFAASSCTQAYRWNLDKVVDPHGNTMTYQYTKETGKYGRNLSSTDVVSYDRGSYLTEIDYGTRDDTSYTAPMRVVIGTADRCLSNCGTHGANWPDTPWDQACTGSPCTHNSPTFWTTKRLASITTQVLDGATYRDVEEWTFTHEFLDPGDGTRAGLWLSKISHQGLAAATAATVPDITFEGVQRTTRVDSIDDKLYPMNWWRIAVIHTETGGKISVTYSEPDCIAGSRMPDQAHLENNTLLCYLVKWTPDFATDPITDFFQKYVVKQVKEEDLTGGAPPVYHDYEYVGPAWHYTDDDGLVKANTKTWSVWRGFRTVRARTGDATTMTQTLTETQYFQGMNGDHLPSGTRSVQLPAEALGGSVVVPAVVDDDAFAGMTRHSITYNGDGGPEISRVVNEPWESAPTATRTINGTTVTARFTGIAAQHTSEALDTDGGTRPAGWRTTSSYTTFDSQAMATKVDDRGDDAVAGDEKCTITTYVRNTTAWLMTYPSRQQDFATSCTKVAEGGLTEDDIIGDGITSYDGQVAGSAPTKGDVTQTETLKSYTNGTPTYLTTARTQYDAYGRITDSWDVDGKHSSRAYTPATGGPLTQVVETNPLLWTTTTTYDPAYGSATKMVDANLHVTEIEYDGLGRTAKVWEPGNSGGGVPNVTYTYLIRNDGATAITTDTLTANGTYVTSTALYDGLLRARQSQAPSANLGGGRIITDTLYDSAGRAYKQTGPYTADGSVSTDLYIPDVPEDLPAWTTTTFDGAGRPIASSFYTKNQLRWTTTTSYTGDRTDVTPPAGGTATSTVTDANDHTVELRQYHGSTPTGGYDATKYTYNNKDQLTRVTDAAGTHWDYEYDLRGRQTKVTDPDRGTSTMTYYDNGRLKSTTDALGHQLTYTYDDLGRKTALHDGDETGPVRAEWFYDTLAKGQPTKSVRHDSSGDFTNEVLGYDLRYQPTQTKITIPATLTGFGATSFSYVNTYKPDGSPNTRRIPAAGGLSLETLTYGYNDLGLPVTLKTNLGGTLVTDTGYTDFGETNIITLQNNAGKIAQIGTYYEDGTRRLHEIKTTSAAAPATTYADAFYSYDDAGNVTEVADATSGDNQCFRYDNLRRLREAWTPASGDCAADPTVAGLGGPTPYWQSWNFDLVGDRTSQVDHGAADVTHDYTYAAASPHAVSTVDTKDADGTVLSTNTYQYDALGNTISRPDTNGQQTLTWDPEGMLSTVTDGSGTTSFVYDADGNRILRKDPAGKTLYLPDQEIRFSNATGLTSCTRYYDWAGRTVAMRTSNAASGLTWLSDDAHGTAQIAITSTTQAVSIQRTNPYGGVRSTTGTWPTALTKGFVGGTIDNTGLTHLGAREYDPNLGRFISVDPVFDSSDPQSWQGYAYADNTPITASDPDGRMVESLGGGGGYVDDNGNAHCGGCDLPKDATTVAAHHADPKPKPKKCGRFDFICRGKKAVTAAVNFVDEHKAAIAGIAVGIAVGSICMVGTLGMGALGCAVVAGAVGGALASATTYGVEVAEGKHTFSWGDFGKTVGIGAVAGAAGALLGAAGGKVLVS